MRTTIHNYVWRISLIVLCGVIFGLGMTNTARAVQKMQFQTKKIFAFQADLLVDKNVSLLINKNGDMVVNFKARNDGNLPTTSFTLKTILQGDKNTVFISKIEVDGFEAGREVFYTPVFSQKLVNSVGTVQQVSILVDSNNQVIERDENNNSTILEVAQNTACEKLSDKNVCILRNDCSWRLIGGCFTVPGKPKVMMLKPIELKPLFVEIAPPAPDLAFGDVFLLPRMTNETLVIYSVNNNGKAEAKGGFENVLIRSDLSTPPKSMIVSSSVNISLSAGGITYQSWRIPGRKNDIFSLGMTIKSITQENNTNNNTATWNPGKDKPLPNCKDIVKEDFCNVAPICEWKWTDPKDIDNPKREGKCFYKQCERLTDKFDCQANLMGCEWVIILQQNQPEPIQRCEAAKAPKPTITSPTDSVTVNTLNPVLIWTYPQNIKAYFRWYVIDTDSNQKVWERDWDKGETVDKNCTDAANHWVCSWATVPAGNLKWDSNYAWYIEAKANDGRAASGYTSKSEFLVRSEFIPLRFKAASPETPQSCSATFVWNGNACVCPQGTVALGGVCTPAEGM